MHISLFKPVPVGERLVPQGELNPRKPQSSKTERQHINHEKTAIPFLATFSIFLVLAGLQIDFTAGQTYPQITPQTTPTILQEQAVQLALQEAQTFNLTPFFGGGLPTTCQVDPNPSNVTFYYSFGVYPKWLITFNATFYWITGHCLGSIQVQVAADTGEIDNTNVTEAPINQSTPTVLPLQNPTATPSLTPTITPTSTNPLTPSPSPSVPEFSAWIALPLVGTAVAIVLVHMRRRRAAP